MANGTDSDALRLEVDDDGISSLVFDRPESRVNILSSGVMRRLDELLTEIEGGARQGRIRGVVVRSAKAGSFIAGADVKEIAGITDPSAAEEGSRLGQGVFRRILALPVPVVAAVDGTCLGGGTELILHCHYRLASDTPKTKIGLPEVRLGIIPGFGGTVRLPRLVGLRSAVEMIVTSKNVGARSAEKMGLVDERVPPGILLARARRVAADARLQAKAREARKKGLTDRLLSDTGFGRKIVLDQARKAVMKETRGHYPAPLAALDVLHDTAGAPEEEAYRREAQELGKLVASDVSKQLVNVYFLMEAAKKSGPTAAPRETDRVAVLGAGVMGGGIAQLLAAKGIAVRLKDIQPAGISAGLRHARELFDKQVKRRRLPKRESKQAMERISPTLEYSGFGSTDVAIEAVVERMDVKKQVLRETEDHVGADAVLATNTSSLSVDEMAGALARPENFCGMHFFNPVHRMPLVEVIQGTRSSDEALATVFSLARRLDKIPLLVRDAPGFLVNRILAPYMNEAGWLLADGASIEDVDKAMLDFGMPMGPLRLLDEVGLDVARHAGRTMHDAFGERLTPAPPLVALESSKRLGRKNERGFYTYENGRDKAADASIYVELGPTVPAERRTLPRLEIQDRLVLVMVNEAARVLEEGVVQGPGDVDLGMITGTGFPPFRGGLLRFADRVGLKHVVARLDELTAQHGPRFEPAPLLRRKAEAGETFHA